MKIIAVTQRLENSKFNELRSQVDIKLFNFIVECGFVPIPIPYFFYKKKKSINCLKKWIKKIKPDGIILSGGEDIGKNKLRDWSEYFIVNYSKKKKIPILGICRGMQILGIFYGSKLIKVKNHVKKNHIVFRNKDKLVVNSYHNYSLKNCPKNFKVIYKSKDNCIESIRSFDLKKEGWMWHPERYKKFKLSDIKSFKKLFF